MKMSKYFNGGNLFALFCTIGLGVVFHDTWDYFPFCDEFENLYDTFLVSRGFLPHIDYWRTKLPGLHLLFAPLFAAMDPLLSKEQIHFAMRLILLLLQCFSQIYFLKGIFAFTKKDAQDKNKYYSRLPLYAIVALLSYSVSPLLRTNLFWQESFQYCYLLIVSGFFLKLNSDKANCRDYIFFGLASSVSVLISLIAVPIVIYVLSFIGIFILVGPSRLRRIQMTRYFISLGVVCLSLILFLIFVIFKIGWAEFYHQIWVINQKYNTIAVFGYGGILGVILKPIEFIWECLATNTFSLHLIPVREVPLTSFIYILSLAMVINYLFLKVGENCSSGLFVVFLFGLVYVSMIRGIAFHVGFVFHFIFTLSIVWLILLYKKRMAADIPLFLKIFLFIPVGVCIYICIFSCIQNSIYIDKKVNYTQEPSSSNFWPSGVKKLLASVDDINAQRHRIWVPSFEPKPLYYTGLMPADKMYMLIPAFLNDPYFVSSYENILTNENILVYPGFSKNIPDKLRKALAKKVEKQFAYLPDSICDINTAIQQKTENQDNRYQYIKVLRLNEPMGGGIRMVGIANRGYRYSFFLDYNTTLSKPATVIIRLRDQNGNWCYSERVLLKKPQSTEIPIKKFIIRRSRPDVHIDFLQKNNQLRIDWEITRLLPNIINEKCDIIIELNLPEGQQTYPILIPFVH